MYVTSFHCLPFSLKLYSGLLVCVLFENEAETKITLAGLKKLFCFCNEIHHDFVLL